ncbi:unnamed protein product [Linum trigynum]|uniref:RNase H type-1 domain-containing protein n=1 Tax=Linum trigynum TaxID=586398 RepID=A0AAV2GFW0_9ROSI
MALILSPLGYAAAEASFAIAWEGARWPMRATLEPATITDVELKGAAVGLQIAWDQAHQHVHLNLDSSIAVAIIKNCSDDDHRHDLMANHVYNILNRD